MEKDVEKSYYEKVKKYITLRPKSTKVEVSAYARIPIDYIERAISDGKFEEYNGYLRVTRKKGMTTPRRNELAQKFVDGLHCEVEPLNTNNNKPESKLVEDLQKRYGTHNNRDGWTI